MSSHNSLSNYRTGRDCTCVSHLPEQSAALWPRLLPKQSWPTCAPASAFAAAAGAPCTAHADVHSLIEPVGIAGRTGTLSLLQRAACFAHAAKVGCTARPSPSTATALPAHSHTEYAPGARAPAAWIGTARPPPAAPRCPSAGPLRPPSSPAITRICTVRPHPVAQSAKGLSLRQIGKVPI